MKHFIISLFNLKDEDISDIDILSSGTETFVFVTLRKKEVRCPACKLKTSRIHDYRERTVLHHLLSERNLTLVYNQRRIRGMLSTPASFTVIDA